jgi:hypothetical protein
MRSVFVTLLFAAIVLIPARAASTGVEFVRVWPGWQDASAFDRISEYFTGHENPGRRTILRTHPEARAGFYFLVRARNSGAALTGATFNLQVIAPDSPDAKTYTFPAKLSDGATVFQLGLTGADWPGPKTHPVAWQLRLLAADGAVLAKAQSFLWEKPAK